MTHPLKIWLKSQKISVVDFCAQRPFSPPTIYRLLKSEGEFGTQTIFNVSLATGNAVTEGQLLSELKRARAFDRPQEANAQASA